MSVYIPDCWVLIEIKSEEYGTIRKILAGWYGGYAGTDSWKLSSGNLQEYVEDDFIVFPQESGSIYRCHKNSQRMSVYLNTIFNNFKNTAKDVGATIEIIKYVL